jgi:hypothetical protein
VFADRSWDGLWNELLCRDLGIGDPLAQFDGDKGSNDTLAIIEEGIESWAAQSLPMLYDPPLETLPVSIPALPDVSLPENGTQVCYGMVSLPYTGSFPEGDLSQFDVPAYSSPLDLPCVSESCGQYA